MLLLMRTRRLEMTTSKGNGKKGFPFLKSRRESEEAATTVSLVRSHPEFKKIARSPATTAGFYRARAGRVCLSSVALEP